MIMNLDLTIIFTSIEMFIYADVAENGFIPFSLRFSKSFSLPKKSEEARGLYVTYLVTWNLMRNIFTWRNVELKIWYCMGTHITAPTISDNLGCGHKFLCVLLTVSAEIEGFFFNWVFKIRVVRDEEYVDCLVIFSSMFRSSMLSI